MTSIPERPSLFIDNQWVHPADARAYQLVSPVTEQVVGTVMLADTASADAAMATARAAHVRGEWRALSGAQRAEVLDRVAAGIEARRAGLVEALGLELGQVAAVASRRVDDTVQVWRRAAADLRGLELRRSLTTEDGRPAQVALEPVGVVLAITPWNSPLLIPALKLAPALAAGCTVVLKPASETVLTLPFVVEALQEAGVPPGSVGVLPADPEVSAYLTTHRDVDKVSFTGSTIVGAKVMAACAGRIARVALELGGKSAAVVLPGENPRELVPRLLGAAGFPTAGQVCVARTRVLVPRAELADWERALAAGMQALVPGGPDDPDTTMGPLATGAQLAGIEKMVKAAIADGARLVTGGSRVERSGWFFEPTLFADVDPTIAIAQKEVFGPVVCLIGYDDLDDAVAIANGTDYGLAASVYGSDLAQAHQVAERLRAGTVHVNTEGAAYDLPFGGFGASGMGREGGVEGILEFLEPKQIISADR